MSSSVLMISSLFLSSHQNRGKQLKVSNAKESSSDYSDDSDLIYLPPPRKKNQQPQHRLNLVANKEGHQSDPISPPGCHGKGNANLRPSVIMTWNGNNQAAAAITQDNQQVPLVSSSSSSLSDVIESDDAQPGTSTSLQKNNFKCYICCYRSDSKANFSYHMNTHTGTKPFNCKDCIKTYSHPASLSKHRKTHLPPQLKCDFCPRMFTFTWQKDHHMNNHTGAKPYECDQCHQRFNQISHLNQHRDIHLAAKYECPFCHKKFSRMAHCKRHWNGRKNGEIACTVRLHQLADKSN